MDRNVYTWLLTALAGAAFVAVTQLATRPELNAEHRIAVTLFALSIPFLATTAQYLREVEKDRTLIPHRVGMAAVLVCVCGMLAFFFSFGWVVGVAFGASGIGSGLMLWFTVRRMR